MIGLSQSQIGKIERWIQPLREDLVPRLAGIFGVQPWEVVAPDNPTARHRALLELFDRLGAENQDRLLRIGETLLKEPAALDLPPPQHRSARRKRA